MFKKESDHSGLGEWPQVPKHYAKNNASTHLFPFKDAHSSNMCICCTNVLIFELKQGACQELQRMVGGYKTEPLSNIVFIKQSCVRLKSIKSGGRRSDEIFIKTHHLWAGLKVGSKSDRVSQRKSSEASNSSNRHSDQNLNIYDGRCAEGWLSVMF